MCSCRHSGRSPASCCVALEQYAAEGQGICLWRPRDQAAGKASGTLTHTQLTAKVSQALALEELGGEDAQRAQQRPAGVDQLRSVRAGTERGLVTSNCCSPG